tara:strand:- start:12953 stop:15670 length:2718 start_codon:yes stop_codon:yes gene_type:complete
MALTDQTRIQAAFKKLVGRAHSRSLGNEGFQNEKYPSNVTVAAGTVFANDIPSLATRTDITIGSSTVEDGGAGATSAGSITDSTVEYVRLELVPIPGTSYNANAPQDPDISNDGAGFHGYYARLPDLTDAGGGDGYVEVTNNPKADIVTFPNTAFVNGAILADSEGKLQCVPPIFGVDAGVADVNIYGAILYDTSGVEIGRFDDRRWSFDYYNGILFQERAVNKPDGDPLDQGDPGFIDVLLYIGDYLTDLTDSDTLAGLTCTDGQVPQWDDSAQEWVCVDLPSTGADDDWWIDAPNNTVGATGTVIIGENDGTLITTIGEDINFFVSGTIGGRDIVGASTSVFGGDLTLSGTILAGSTGTDPYGPSSTYGPLATGHRDIVPENTHTFVSRFIDIGLTGGAAYGGSTFDGNSGHNVAIRQLGDPGNQLRFISGGTQLLSSPAHHRDDMGGAQTALTEGLYTPPTTPQLGIGGFWLGFSGFDIGLQFGDPAANPTIGGIAFLGAGDSGGFDGGEVTVRGGLCYDNNGVANGTGNNGPQGGPVVVKGGDYKGTISRGEGRGGDVLIEGGDVNSELATSLRYAGDVIVKGGRVTSANGFGEARGGRVGIFGSNSNGLWGGGGRAGGSVFIDCGDGRDLNTTMGEGPDKNGAVIINASITPGVLHRDYPFIHSNPNQHWWEYSKRPCGIGTYRPKATLHVHNNLYALNYHPLGAGVSDSPLALSGLQVNQGYNLVWNPIDELVYYDYYGAKTTTWTPTISTWVAFPYYRLARIAVEDAENDANGKQPGSVITVVRDTPELDRKTIVELPLHSPDEANEGNMGPSWTGRSQVNRKIIIKDVSGVADKQPIIIRVPNPDEHPMPDGSPRLPQLIDGVGYQEENGIVLTAAYASLTIMGHEASDGTFGWIII